MSDTDDRMAEDRDPDGRILDAIASLAPPLLDALEALRYLARHMDPAQIAEHLASVDTPEGPLQAALPAFRAAEWPDHLSGFRDHLTASSDLTIQALTDLRVAITAPDGLRQAYRALRLLPRALEALYPLTQSLPVISRFFLEPGRRDDVALLTRLREANPAPENTGVIHIDNDRKSRGGVSIYVPEYYDTGRSYPLVMALHGGSGHGSTFLWNWLVSARSEGAILLAPTAIGDTWSLMGPDVDSGNLARLLAFARANWNIDSSRLLLTGMSDGGTFTLLSGMQEDSPFTHLAPFAASFHPMLVELAEPARLAGLPIHLTHGALDWMFPVRIGRQAAQSLARAGARVTYREIEDLSHVYPADENPRLLNWLMARHTENSPGSSSQN